MFPTGFFFYVNEEKHEEEEEEQVVVLRRWDEGQECLVEVRSDDDEEEEYDVHVSRARADPKLLNRMLRYKPEWRETWAEMSRHITRDTIERVSPLSKCISVLGEPDAVGGKPSEGERRLEEQLREGRGRSVASSASMSAASAASTSTSASSSASSSKCFYLEIPRKLRAQGLRGRDLTAIHMDKTALLEDLVERKLGGRYEELLGELQFSFVSFLMCQSMAGFMQWKQILALVFSCEEAPLVDRTDFYVELLRTLRSQLRVALGGEVMQDDGGILRDILQEENFLFSKCNLGTFLEITREADSIDVALAREVDALVGVATRYNLLVGGGVGRGGGGGGGGRQGESTTFGWEEEGEEDDEYMPVVVDL